MDTMRIILFMAFMGNCVLAVYFCLNWLSKKLFSASWRIGLLKLSLIYFLLPMPLLKNEYFNFTCWINRPILLDDFKKSIYTNSKEVIHLFQGEKIVHPSELRLLIVLLIIWILGVLFHVVRLLIIHRQLKKSILNCTCITSNEETIHLFNRQKEAFHMKKPIVIRYSDFIDTPMTYGFFAPVILLPTRQIADENLEFILQHELMHIRHHDYLAKLLCMAACAIHWYNPLSYLLLKEMTVLCEYSCDESISAHLNKKQKLMYGSLILDLSLNAGKSEILKTPISLFAYNDKLILKERMRIVKNSKPIKKTQLFASAVTMTFTVLLSSLTVFAFAGHPTVTSEPPEYSLGEEISFRFVSQADMEEKQVVDLPDEIGTIGYFVNEQGEVYFPSMEKGNEKACSHYYKTGTYIKHSKNSNGGCKEVHYYAEYCQNCDHYVLGAKFKTIEENKCPH